jgi:aryl-alcohol dehydrogenase-like predicted oxidoreductase
VPYEAGVRAAQQIALFTPQGATTAQFALRWIADQPGVSTVIPGARNAEQAAANAAAADLPALSEDVLRALRDIYDDSIREHVHDRW